VQLERFSRPLRRAEREGLEELLRSTQPSTLRKAAPLIGIITIGLSFGLGWYVASPAGIVASALAYGYFAWPVWVGVIAAFCFLQWGNPIGAGVSLAIVAGLGALHIRKKLREPHDERTVDTEGIKAALASGEVEMIRVPVTTAVPLLDAHGQTIGVFVPLSFEEIAYFAADPAISASPCAVYEASSLPSVARRWSGGAVPSIGPLSQTESNVTPEDGALYRISVGSLLASPEKLALARSGSVWP
jgi:hypothetical protein